MAQTVKNLPAVQEILGSIPGPGRSPGEGNGNPLQYSCLGNPMDRGAWKAAWGCKESDMTERLHFHFTFSIQNKKFKMWEKIVWEFGYITGAKCLREIYLVKYVNYLDVNQKINKNNCLKLYVK